MPHVDVLAGILRAPEGGHAMRPPKVNFGWVDDDPPSKVLEEKIDLWRSTFQITPQEPSRRWHRRSSSYGTLEGASVKDSASASLEDAARTTGSATPTIPDSGGHGNTGVDFAGPATLQSGATTDDLQSYLDYLVDDFKPVPPVASCPESMRIYNEHKEIAIEYLQQQQEIMLLKEKQRKLRELVEEEQKKEAIQNQNYQEKIRELEKSREALTRKHYHLRQQLERLHARQGQRQEVDTNATYHKYFPAHT